MIDVPTTLAPTSGIALACAVAPPEPPAELLWRTVVELDTGITEPGAADSIPSSDRNVGAYGHSRADALLRGAGEAVERAALHPARGPLAGRRLGRFPEEYTRLTAIVAPLGAEAEHVWYPARRLRDDASALVPAPAVDWPPAAEGAEDWFDPGPSGAASGAGRDMALRNALLEMVERDAIMTAWQRGLRLPQVILPDAGPRPVREAQRLRTAAQAAGTRTVLAEIPTAVPGVFCCTAVALDDDGQTAAVGSKASLAPAAAALGALQEALQIHSLLRNARALRTAVRTEKITGEKDRIAFLLTREAGDLIRDWVDGFRSANVLPADTAAPDVSPQALVSALVADGADPLLVDLTPRLPGPLKSMGWTVVKVIPVGYQPLRMSEEPTWNWNGHRLRTAEERTALTARYAPEQYRPHPLP
ncbi:YcaO-like family protein [Streptomyces sp. DSM 41972]|uniref:YcaO-like family protein n=1 Tax=Streptomyces althioticus subsp. attaecolombicae TaxID=3075534 RepID=A0ABU3I1D9_9ACTN|nr:YcaO-like family protein [Streptomyces sp. DSM 41972]SCD31130.1 ribosomal protein S12 methylthiotransferase accessory factor [Streptomyces sp. di50b]SCE29201.1 ribosomal protein S12 methylthiotransferase accessory factor [Streptomyces sp. di188]